MWPFKSVTNLQDSGIFEGFTDWHSHILPGVDDGIASIEDAVGALRVYESLGFRRVWLTPHIMDDYPNRPEELNEVFGKLKNVWDGNVELKLAAEHMLDSLFEERMEEGSLMPIGDEGRHILVETSYFNPPMAMDGILSGIRREGYSPVLAHPERYVYMEKEHYRRLRDVGTLFQLNLTSLAGAFGERAREKAEWLLSQGYIDLLGTDLHRLHGFEAIIRKSPRKKAILEKAVEVARSRNSL